MRIGAISLAGLAFCTTCLPCWSRAQTSGDVPHLTKQGNATQLVVDGKPFLILSGELTNNAATALAPMEPIWPKLVSSNLNTVLVGVWRANTD